MRLRLRGLPGVMLQVSAELGLEPSPPLCLCSSALLVRLRLFFVCFDLVSLGCPGLSPPTSLGIFCAVQGGNGIQQGSANLVPIASVLPHFFTSGPVRPDPAQCS
jgi:hypothetical protein